MKDNSAIDIGPVQKAWLFSARNHQGQLYPGTELPYIVHIGAVCLELFAALNAAPDLNVELALCCALLHDTVEDTSVAPDDLVREFGPAVAAGVGALTKDKAVLRGESAMLDSLARIRQQPREVWVVKLADRSANLGTPPKHWSREKCHAYAAEAELILQELGDASAALAARLKDKIAVWKRM